jgi:acyl-CoA reductase-like NAD-dependent aldehyde dehydrogenase
MTATQLRSQHTVPGTYRPKGMLIGGKWVGSDSDQRIAIENPAKRTAIAEVPRAGAADVEAAVAAAERAFPSWKNMVPRERGKLLLKIAEAIEVRAEELARTIAVETGNALRTQARGESKLVISAGSPRS